jgi:hypothetical protein
MLTKNKYRNKKLKESARDQACVCHGNEGTTVWAHSNSLRHGKGTGVKAHDLFGAYLCHESHQDYDQLPEFKFTVKYGLSKDEWFSDMWDASMIIVCNKGLLGGD